MEETTDDDLELLSPNLKDKILKLQILFGKIKEVEASFGLDFNLFINKILQIMKKLLLLEVGQQPLRSPLQ